MSTAARIVVCALLPSVSLASTTPQNLEAVVTTSWEKTAKAFRVDVAPPAGTKLNFDGPWELAVEGDIPFSQGKALKLGKNDFDKATSRFRLPVEATPPSDAQAKFKMKYFLCAEDNSWCKRIVKSGTLSTQAGK